MQHTLIYYLNGVDMTTPHTEVVKTPSWRRGRRDPRYSLVGKAEMRLCKSLGGETVDALGNAGDLAIIRTDNVAHRAVIPSTGTQRNAIFISVSNDLKIEPTGSELYSFDQKTMNDWEETLSDRQLGALDHCMAGQA